MKNRKIVVVAFIAVAALLLGVGYAALTDSLTIIGNAHIDLEKANKTFDEKVYFTKAEVTGGNGTGTTSDVAALTSDKSDDATYTANELAVKGEFSEFTFTIKNESNADALISIAPTKLSGVKNPSNSNENKFDVEYAYPDGMTAAKNGGTIRVVVTVRVKDVIHEATSATFGIELTATSVEDATTTPVETE